MSHQISYFLIGGSGFLGTAFMKYLHNKGISARDIRRGEISDSKSLHFREETLEHLPVSDTKNIIVDFAYTSVPNTSFTDPVHDFTENLYNINSHLAFASRLPNATYVYISSGGTVYGNVVNKVPIPENAENTPLSPYGITKLASEKYSLMHKAIYGLDVRIVRPSNIYGPGQKPFRGQGFIATAIAKMILHQPIQLFGDGSSIRDYLFVDDLCDALFSVVTKGESGTVYNIGSGTGYSTNKVLDIIHSTLASERYPGTEYLPGRPFDVSFNILNISRIRELNKDYYKIQLEEGIQEAYRWIKDYLQSLQ